MARPRNHRLRWIALIVAGVAVWHVASTGETWGRAAILDAIRAVESGGRDDPPDGDDGRAIGPYQIHQAYWLDATTLDPSIGGRYQDCRRRAYAESVIDAYMRRYVPAAWKRGDAETIARTHNGGPGGANDPRTLGYWEKVRARLR